MTQQQPAGAPGVVTGRLYGLGVGRRADPERIRSAQLQGNRARLADLLRLGGDESTIEWVRERIAELEAATDQQNGEGRPLRADRSGSD